MQPRNIGYRSPYHHILFIVGGMPCLMKVYPKPHWISSVTLFPWTCHNGSYIFCTHIVQVDNGGVYDMEHDLMLIFVILLL
jgi:hypothetical protein